MAFIFFVRLSITSNMPSHGHVKQPGVYPCSFDIRVIVQSDFLYYLESSHNMRIFVFLAAGFALYMLRSSIKQSAPSCLYLCTITSFFGIPYLLSELRSSSKDAPLI
jgi:hypothetical protein